MKFVVTGALGHIGSRLIRELPDLYPGAEVVMIDNLSTQRYCSLFNLPAQGRYRFHEADVLSADLPPLFEDADVVFHLAAVTDAAGSFDNRERVEHNNYNATVKVAEACREAGCRMVHMSTTSVYGTQQAVVDEQCALEELRPQSPYAETKLREERFVQESARARGLRCVILRFGTICGVSPGMRFHTAVNKFCWQAAFGQPLTVWRTALRQKRPYLDLKDAVVAYRFVVAKDLFDGAIYNVLTRNLTVDDIVGMIRRHIPDLAIRHVDTEIMNQLSYEVSCKKIADKGWVVSGDMEASVADTICLLKAAGGRT
jgi:nucleoside-diphosphate-sugar epimerase